MSKHGVIRRFTLEIEKISSKQYPSFEEIKTYVVNHGFEVSDRTIQRDIEQIRFEFGIDIKYNRARMGYYIDYENSINTESFFKFLKIVNTAELLTESISESKNTLNSISFDGGNELKGIGNLEPILRAIKDKKIVSFNYFSFRANQPHKFLLEPYLLQEYENRWYVIGFNKKSNDYRTFGIDRVDDLIVTTENFIAKDKFKPSDQLEKTIGVNYSAKSAEKVILSFTPQQGKYIKSLPLHSSQYVLIDNKTEFRISIEVIPNLELIQLILKHGYTVKVIEPLWLVDEIKINIQRMMKKY